MAPRKIGPLPLPSPNLADQPLPILTYRETLVRIHRIGNDPAFRGNAGEHRFDAPAGEFGVLYAAVDAYGAFIETCGDTRDRIVTTAALGQRGWARVEPTRALRLVDLSGSGLAQIGADERLCSGEHDIARKWLLAMWQHPASVDGLYYRARHDPSRNSVALFDRAEPSVSIVRDGGLLDDRHQLRLAGILEAYQFSLL
jgi:hypothetical protein